MKHLATQISAFCVLFLIASPFALSETIQAQEIIGYWNFNDNTPESNTNWTEPIPATQGSGEITYTVSEAYSFTGTSSNSLNGDASGGSFVPRGGVGQENNGESFTISASTAGLDEIYVSWANRGTSTGFNSREIQYTINGTDWISKKTLSGTLSDWEIVTVDFSDIPEVNNNPDFAVRVILSGVTSDAGNNRFDNIIVQSGMPAEPTITTVSNIGELISTAQAGNQFEIAGEVIVTYYAGGSRNQFYIQDNTGAILIDDNGATITTNYGVGDGISGFQGEYALFYSTRQFVPLQDPGAPSSTGNDLPIVSTTLAELDVNSQSLLVILEGVSFEGISEGTTFVADENYQIVDASLPSGETIVFRTAFDNADYIGEQIPSGEFDLVGIVNEFQDNPQVTARSLEDFTLNTFAQAQIIHNSADPVVSSVDIYVDGTLTFEDIAFRSATGFVELPSNTAINIGITPTGQPLSSGVTFQNQFFDTGNYYVVANGVIDPSGFEANPSGEDISLSLDVISDAEMSAADENTFSFKINHGVTDAPAVDIFARDVAPLAQGVVYGTTTADYIDVPAGSYTIDVSPEGGDAIASFEADANSLGGQTALILASGFLTPDDDQNGEPFGALLVLTDGTTVLLPGVSTSIDEFSNLPQEFALEQNYPNPFNPSTQIEYALPQAADVQIAVYNVVGQRVALLLNNEQQAAGYHTVSFDASNLASGMYLYRIQAGSYIQTRKMTLIK